MSVASFSIIIASMTFLALASDESTRRVSPGKLAALGSELSDAPTVILTDHALSKRSLKRQSHHIIIERRPVSRGPPRRRRRPIKIITSFRSKGRPKPPKSIYGPPKYSYGKPVGYLLMNHNNEIIHQSKDFPELPAHFFDSHIPPSFINDDPPTPYQEEPEIIPAPVAYESHSSHKDFPPPPSLASEEVHTWTQYEEPKPQRRPPPPPPPEEVYSWPRYEEKPKVRRKKPSTTPQPTPPTSYPSYSSPLKPQPPSTSYGIPVSPFSVSSFNPWLNGLKESAFPGPPRQKPPTHPSFPSNFELEHDQEKNVYDAPVSSYDVPLNYVSSDTKPSSPSYGKHPAAENFDVGSFENNPSSSYQTYLPPQLPESYNEEDFPGVTRHRQKPHAPVESDYSGEITHSEDDFDQPLTFSYQKPSHNTRKPVFRQTPSAHEAFESFVRELRPSHTTASPPTHTPTIINPQPTTRRPRQPTISHRPRVRPTSNHNLDTDDLREAYFESSASLEDYNFDPEPVNFESMRFPPDSRSSGSDKRPQNYVLVSAANRDRDQYRESHTTTTENYPKHHPAFLPKPSNIDIISIQKSKSKTYFGGTTTSTRPPKSNPRGTHRQYTKSQISRHDDMSLLQGENYRRPPTTSHKFNPSLHFTKNFSSKIAQSNQANQKYQQTLWNGQELPKNHKITNRDTS